MKITLEGQAQGYAIQGYAQGEIRIRGPSLSSGAPALTVHTRGVVVSPEHLITEWGPHGQEGLEEVHLASIAALEPQVILLGLGARPHPLPAQLMKNLIALKIGFEIMDTGAACRTYNVLAAEGRRVVAALLIG
jgi:uncharacterized protein